MIRTRMGKTKNARRCTKLDTCCKITMILCKDFDEHRQYRDSVCAVCSKCNDYKEAK